MKAIRTLTDPFEIAMFWINTAERHGIKCNVSSTKVGAAKKLENESISEKFNISIN